MSPTRFNDTINNSVVEVLFDNGEIKLSIDCNDNPSADIKPVLTLEASKLAPIFTAEESLFFNVSFKNEKSNIRADLNLCFHVEDKVLQMSQQISETKNGLKVRCLLFTECSLQGQDLYKFLALVY